MSAWIINGRRIFSPENGIDAIEGLKYHGIVDTRYPQYDNLLGDEESAPLHLIREVSITPPLVKPSRNFCVSPRLKASLAGLPSVGLLPVQISGAYDCRTGDSSVFDDYESFTDWATGSGLLHRVPAHLALWELRTFKYSDVEVQYRDLSDATFTSPTYGAERSCRISKKLFEQFPLLWHPEGVIVGGIAVALLGDALNADFFSISEILVK